MEMAPREARRRGYDDARKLGAAEVLVAGEGDGADLEITGVAFDVLCPQSAGKSDRKKQQERGEKNPSHHPRIRAGAASRFGASSIGSTTSGARSAIRRAM